MTRGKYDHHDYLEIIHLGLKQLFLVYFSNLAIHVTLEKDVPVWMHWSEVLKKKKKERKWRARKCPFSRDIIQKQFLISPLLFLVYQHLTAKHLERCTPLWCDLLLTDTSYFSFISWRKSSHYRSHDNIWPLISDLKLQQNISYKQHSKETQLYYNYSFEKQTNHDCLATP